MKSMARFKSISSKLVHCIARSLLASTTRRHEAVPVAALSHAILIITLLALAIAPALLAQRDARPGGGLVSRDAITVNAATGKVYAVETDRGAVAVFNGAGSSTTSVKVGAGPIAVAVNFITGRAYVLNHESGTITVLDGRSDATLATIDVGGRPFSIAVDPSTNKVYVSNVFSNVLTIIDGATNKTSTLKAVSADALATDASLHQVYLLGYEGSDLEVLDTTTNALSRISVGVSHLWGLARDASAQTLYITRIGNGDIVALNLQSHRWTAIPTGKFPSAVALNSRTNRAYVSNYGDDSVTVIDMARQRAVATVHVGGQPQALVIDEESNRIYVANTQSNSISLIEGATNKVSATLDAGPHPYALALDLKGRTLYTANVGAPFHTSIDLKPRTSSTQ
jgi:YVTN family beta-propeller protein